MDLKDSRTKENLMRAFAGESQARNRYTYAAELAQKNGLFVIKKVFDFTAEQEKKHGQIFYNYLKEFEGEEITIDAAYPVNTSDNVTQQLLQALNNETREAGDVYRSFGNIAKEEGFAQIAGKFFLIADIEQTHADRFRKFHDLLKEGKLFVSDVKTGWMCLNCGHTLESTSAPEKCPVCDSDQGYYVRISMSPYHPGGATA